MCFNLKKSLNLYSKVTLNALKHLCLSANHKAAFRNIVSQAVYTILYNLEVDHIIDMIKYFLLLADDENSNRRVFGLEGLDQFLINSKKVDSSFVPETEKIYLSHFPVIFSILTRCDDKSPIVRRKALSLLSQHMIYILNYLKSNGNNQGSINEVYEENFEHNVDVNGNHRKFWYNLESYSQRLDEICNILHRRVEDNSATTRKAAVQALESLIIFDKTYLNAHNSKDFLQFFIIAATDTNMTIRIQVIHSLTAILDSFDNESDVLECWLKCVLPLVQDPESAVKTRALRVIEEKFLVNIFSNKERKQTCAFNLLRKLCFGELLSHEFYLQTAFGIWKLEGKLSSLNFKNIENLFKSNEDDFPWFFLGLFSLHKKVPQNILGFTVKEFKIFKDSEAWPACADYILKVLKHACFSNNLSPKTLTSIKSILREKLKCATVPVESIESSIELLCEVERRLDNEEEFKNFACNIIKNCTNHLASVVSGSIVDTAGQCMKHLCTVQKLCPRYRSSITQDLILSLKTFCFCGKSLTSSVLHEVMTPDIQAVSCVALGKICLLDETMAKELMPAFAKELLNSKEAVVRNNVVIVMIDMCRKYPSFTDKYLCLICSCLRDKEFLIRYQTLCHLCSLLQEGFKLKGSLFFCILYTIVDAKERIQELGEYCLGMLYSRKCSLFSENFVDSIFFFNSFSHPKNKISQLLKKTCQFSLKGKSKMQKRVQIYEYMLECMDLSSKATLIRQLCKEILRPVAESVFEFNETTENMVRDCFVIMKSEEFRVHNDEKDDELQEEGNFNEELLAIRLEIVPVVISLNNRLLVTGSYLRNDIIMFLEDMLEDIAKTSGSQPNHPDLLRLIDNEDEGIFVPKSFSNKKSNNSSCEENEEQLDRECSIALTPVTPHVLLSPLRIPLDLDISNISEIEMELSSSSGHVPDVGPEN